MEGIPKTEADNEPQSSSSNNSDTPSPQSISLEQQTEESHLFKPIIQVFNVELLMEKIIDYVIHDRNQLSPADIKASRLVQKSWLTTVSKTLRKQQTPLFYLHLDANNSLEQSTQQTGKLLDQFLIKVSSRTSPTFENDHIPPFAIKATQDFFKEENYLNFKDVLLKCGSGLVKMDLEIPRNGGSMPFLLPFSPQLSLPILTDFTVRFAVMMINGVAVGNNEIATALYLMQSVLNASHHSLKKFKLPLSHAACSVPSGFEYLTLPVTLTWLDLSCLMNSKNLRILLNNPLPKLRQIELTIPATPLDDGLISKMFEKYSNTLEYACFTGIQQHDGNPRHPTYFDFPGLMKNLKQIVVYTPHLELGNDLYSLETYLPKINSLILAYQTVPMYRKWVNSSKFETVEELKVSLVDKNFHGDHENFYKNVEAEIMQSMHLTFPNLTSLCITLCGSDEMNGLQYLFLEMKKLENLFICVRRTNNLLNSDFWDSLLIGVEIELAAKIRAVPGFFESFKIKDLSRPSIRNLAGLRRFKIKTKDSSPALANVSLISDSVFHFGFCQLPRLSKLMFGGRFSASEEMKSKWIAQTGGRITYKFE